MSRVIPTTLLVAAVVVACAKDSGPTTPSAAGLSAAAAVANAEDDDNGGGGRPTADDVAASVVFTHVHVKSRECEGEDGHYFEGRHVFSGVSTGDSRLTGNIEIRVRDLYNATQETGPNRGHIVITDAATGRTKAKGDYNTWGPADMVQGTIVGVVKDEGVGGEPTSGAGNWLANWRITYHPEGGVTAQIGGVTDDNRLPAGLWRGGCSGKWTEFDVDIGSSGLGPSAINPRQNWRAPRL